MPSDWLLTPPAAFLIMLAVAGLFSLIVRGLATRSNPSSVKTDSYACGQEVPTGRVQPGYDDFFHFAFLFTILEVVALILGTVPANGIWLTLVVLSIVVLALLILFRRD